MPVRDRLPDRAHVVLRGAAVLSMDPDVGELERGDIEIADGRIVGVAPRIEAAAAEVVDATGTVALPGFVDTHWHLWGTLLRGVIGDGPEHGWFARKGALAPHMTPEDTYRGVALALAEGLAAGITTVHDWAHNVLSPEDADADLRAHRDLGARVHFSYGAPSTTPGLSLEQMRSAMADRGKSVDEAMDFDDLDRIADEWLPGADGLLSLGVAVRGPARSSAKVYRREWMLARERGLPIAMHCAGTRAEVARLSQVRILEAEGLLGDDVLLAHGNHLDDEEMGLLARRGVPVSVSPMSELRLAMGFPKISELREAGVEVSFSLDTTAIAATADPFTAMRVAVGLENVRAGDARRLLPRQVLELATIAGARTLRLGDRTGSLTPGKRADVILVRVDGLGTAPAVDPAVAVVHSATPADVDTVVVDGRILKRDGRLVHVDVPAVVEAATGALHALCARAGFDLSTVGLDTARA